MTSHRPITFHPFRTNVLDCVGRTDLVTETGQPVTIGRNMAGEFVITIAGEVWRSDDNLAASGYLVRHGVGVRQ